MHAGLQGFFRQDFLLDKEGVVENAFCLITAQYLGIVTEVTL